MKCPVCNEQMSIANSDVSNNQKTGSEYREYDRRVFKCELDDTWVTVEMPM